MDVRHVVQVTFQQFHSHERDIAAPRRQATSVAAHNVRGAAPLRETSTLAGRYTAAILQPTEHMPVHGIDVHCLAACKPHQGM
jgi:hypothetical protein